MFKSFKMKYLDFDQDTVIIIDDCFNSNFMYFKLNRINVQPDMYSIFPWSHDFNNEDVEIMFEDLKNELEIKYYVPKQYRSSIKFLNYVMKQIPNLRDYYIKPRQTYGIFRKYYLKTRN